LEDYLGLNIPSSTPPFFSSSILPDIYSPRFKNLGFFNLANGTGFFKMRQVGYLKM
jgi:hypothetical protein